MSSAFHKSNLGRFASYVEPFADMNGYVPTTQTGPWELQYDHGTEKTHVAGGLLTEYGYWWEEERFPELRDEAVHATIDAEKELDEWRTGAMENNQEGNKK